LSEDIGGLERKL